MSTLQFNNNETHSGAIILSNTGTSLNCSGGGNFAKSLACPYVDENYAKFVDDFYGNTFSSAWNNASTGNATATLNDGSAPSCAILNSSGTEGSYAQLNWNGKNSIDITKNTYVETRIKLLQTSATTAPAQANCFVDVQLSSTDFKASIGYYDALSAGGSSANFYVRTWNGATTFSTTSITVDASYHYFKMTFLNGGDLTVYHRTSQSNPWASIHATAKESLGTAPAQIIFQNSRVTGIGTSLYVDYIKLFTARE